MKKYLESKRPKSIFGPDIVLAITILGVLVILMAIWMQIQAKLHWESGMEYGFMVLYPIVFGTSILLFLVGIAYLMRSIFWRDTKKSLRISAAAAGVLLLLPGLYLAEGIAAQVYVTENAKRIVSDREALSLIQSCKARYIRREFTSWAQPLSQNNMTAKIYLKDTAMSQAEKDSYFYGYRSFDPKYYEELAKTVAAQRQKCGNVELYDEWRESWPSTYTWLTAEEARASLDACEIKDVITTDAPAEGLTSLASNSKNAKTSIFRVLNPISEGYAGVLYIADTDKTTHKSLLDFAKNKKGHCRYKQPNIDGVE